MRTTVRGPTARRHRTEEVTMRYRSDPVKHGGEDDDGQGGNPNGGCGDGQGCGRQ
ncbi:hypothetical protein AB0D04_22480 [Streptomyces sp. NPDC048483]|uniref:hypothetical protein n=1 Tax=Streptomyces sp. NPDC048483 TaxID=3154927 RepID=UPI00342610DF